MKSINERIPRKMHATHDGKVDGDGEHYAKEARDKNNPLDM